MTPKLLVTLHALRDEIDRWR